MDGIDRCVVCTAEVHATGTSIFENTGAPAVISDKPDLANKLRTQGILLTNDQTRNAMYIREYRLCVANITGSAIEVLMSDSKRVLSLSPYFFPLMYTGPSRQISATGNRSVYLGIYCIGRKELDTLLGTTRDTIAERLQRGVHFVVESEETKADVITLMGERGGNIVQKTRSYKFKRRNWVEEKRASGVYKKGNLQIDIYTDQTPWCGPIQMTGAPDRSSYHDKYPPATTDNLITVLATRDQRLDVMMYSTPVSGGIDANNRSSTEYEMSGRG